MGSPLMFFVVAINHPTNHPAAAMQNLLDLFHILQVKKHGQACLHGDRGCNWHYLTHQKEHNGDEPL
jgi:hypothetical protein